MLTTIKAPHGTTLEVPDLDEVKVILTKLGYYSFYLKLVSL
jgi:hypothetical protein